MAEAGNSTQFIKLYSKATIMGYQRNHHYQRRSCSLLKIEGVNNKDDAEVSWPSHTHRVISLLPSLADDESETTFSRSVAVCQCWSGGASVTSGDRAARLQVAGAKMKRAHFAKSLY
jgi:hypothetical protein